MGKDHIKNPRNCRDCAYVTYGNYCGYILVTGHQRPCEPGDGCKVKKTDHSRRKAWMKAERRTPQPVREPNEHKEIIKRMHEYWGQTHCKVAELMMMFPEYKSDRHIMYKNIRRWEAEENETEKNGGGAG